MWYQVLETQPSKADATWHLCEKNSTPEWLRTVLWSAWRRVRVVCSVSVLRPVFVSSCLVLCVLCLVLSCHGAGSTGSSTRRLPGPLRKARAMPSKSSTSKANPARELHLHSWQMARFVVAPEASLVPLQPFPSPPPARPALSPQERERGCRNVRVHNDIVPRPRTSTT